MIRVAIPALAFALAMPIVASAAGPSSLSVVNASHQTITHLYVQPLEFFSNSKWGKDVLAGKHLSPGATWKAQLQMTMGDLELKAPGFPDAAGTDASDICPWAVRAVFATGSYTDVKNINFCKNNPVVRITY